MDGLSGCSFSSSSPTPTSSVSPWRRRRRGTRGPVIIQKSLDAELHAPLTAGVPASRVGRGWQRNLNLPWNWKGLVAPSFGWDKSSVPTRNSPSRWQTRLTRPPSLPLSTAATRFLPSFHLPTPPPSACTHRSYHCPASAASPSLSWRPPPAATAYPNSRT